LAKNILEWTHSGFSVDYAISVPVFSIRAREALSQYIARPPLSLKKISSEENGVGTVISFSSNNELLRNLQSIPLPLRRSEPDHIRL